MSRTRLPKLARLLRPIVRRQVENAIARAELALGDDDLMEQWIDSTAERLDERIDLSEVPFIGPALEAADGPVIRALLAAGVAEAEDRMRLRALVESTPPS